MKLKTFSKGWTVGESVNDWDAHVEGGDAHINKPLPALFNSPSNPQLKDLFEESGG